MRGASPAIPRPPLEYQELVCGPRDDVEAHFDQVGEVLAAWLVEAGLAGAGRRLLDVGCGCGRLARHLVRVPDLRYTGFDRHPGMIRWCRSEIGRRVEGFQFDCHRVTSAYDRRDGHSGTISVSRFRFPYAEGTYDSIVAASVFTHMPLAETSHYLGECARVLAPGGRILGSVFVARETPWDDGLDFHYRAADFWRRVRAAGLRPDGPDGGDGWVPRTAETAGRQRWFCLRHG